jgi:uncharacterized protein
MDPLKIIQKYYDQNSKAYQILVEHSGYVTQKALQIAKNRPDLNLDLEFIREAAMLHDIGMIYTNAPDLDCYGEHPYICHGYLGSDLLKKEGLPRHALVCERHTGVGISLTDILNNNIPIPHRDMQPQTPEEEIIALADKFYSKTGEISQEKTVSKIKAGLSKFGDEKVKKFEEWLKKYKLV